MYSRDVMSRLRHVLWRSDLESTRMWLSLGALLWAVMLWWPGETFARPTYTLMEKFASEHVWALAFTIQGGVMLWSLLWGYKSRFTMLLDAVLGTVLWTVSCVAMMLSVYPPPAAISAEIASAVASWWLLVRYQLPKVKHES